ncbi:MAG: hypothetical protein HQ483_15805 [Rhodospirillales bacterium]|nr:hypothetical protein [Rhodospirillales bacterium]
MLAKGEGGDIDPESALMWFHVAAALGNAQARQNRDRYAKTQPQSVQTRAAERARRFRPRSSLQ